MMHSILIWVGQFEYSAVFSVFYILPSVVVKEKSGHTQSKGREKENL